MVAGSLNLTAGWDTKGTAIHCIYTQQSGPQLIPKWAVPTPRPPPPKTKPSKGINAPSGMRRGLRWRG